MNKVFLHVDLDAFFASVEQLDHPEYRGKPVIVGGLPSDRRSVVSTASYEARSFGVHSAMPTFRAVKLCPHGIFLRPNMRRYHEKSEEVMAIFKDYSPDIQQISVDEAFIDLTGTERLFGPPEDVAKRLKKEVLEKTGLTVSVGLASTKYCAKIASGLQKPDGLTIVPFGKESEFMLSLPITKVWGAGKKTLAKLESYGIKTTRDIYARSEKLLQSLFGNAVGTFLYNAVRGNAGEDFHSNPKSRSISAENTYEYDLTNPEIIETALLSLCHTVMFRSLREKVRSSTVSLKIRYEDFTTVSVQSTTENYVSNVDDLFERVKELLKKKYNDKLGIRLLGVALQNLEDEGEVRQRDLFDFGDEKKRRLENAILKAQEKNPALKITKARLLDSSSLKSLFLPFVLALTIFLPRPLSADTEKESDGAAGIVFDASKLPLSDSGKFVSLFNKDFGEDDAQNIEFFASGFWKSTVTTGAAYSFGSGEGSSFSLSSPVFAQNVDLSLYFMLNQRWYFEAAFADEFTKNTVAAGYIGSGILKSARISNRKIIFPAIYSVDDVNRGIGGGENQAPGISVNWAVEKWQADAALRYDMLEAHEKTWYGKNAVSINEITLSAYNTGNQYILPKSSLVQNVKAVYVESSSGSFRDTKGRKYKKLDESQYLLLASQNAILLSKDAKAKRQGGVKPAVAVTFYADVSQSDFGSYDDESTFLGKVQEWFNEVRSEETGARRRNLNLKNYSYTIFNSIDGEDCLFLQHPSGFSPFAVASRYDLGSSQASDAQVRDKSSGEAIVDYNVVIDEDGLRFSDKDFFYPNHLYADISRAEDDDGDETQRLIHASFPLAPEHPKIYLGLDANEDLALEVRTFTPVNRFEIGTDAVSGTVTVYKNGVIDTAASYDSESGAITLSSAVAASDHITARWYEESEDAESGAVAAAGGFKYDFTENLSADVSSSLRWGFSPDKKYADENVSSQGFAAVASKISYEGERFKSKNTVAISYENANTTGKYKIFDCDESDEETYYLSKKAGIDLPDGFTPSINEKTPSGTTQINLKPEKKSPTGAEEGKTDSEISGYAIPLEWDFSGIEAGEGENMAWAAISVYLPGTSSILENASTFSISLKNPAPEEKFDSEQCALYLQLGVSSDDDFSVEDTEKIPTWKISDSAAEQVKNSFDFSESGWQIVTVMLTDEDRSAISFLQDTNARLILTKSAPASLPESGVIYAGPYGSGETVFSVKTSSEIATENYQKDGSQYFEWNFSGEKDEETISFSKRFSEIDLSEYKKLSFKLGAKNAQSVQIRLYRQKSSGEKNALIYNISPVSEDFKEYTVDFSKKSDSNLTFVDETVIPTKLEIKITAKDDGNLTFDALTLLDNKPFVVFQDKTEAAYKIDGVVLEGGIFEILKNVEIKGATSIATSVETRGGMQNDKNLKGQASLRFTLTNLKFGTDFSLSNAYKNATSGDDGPKNALESGSHNLETEKPILKILSFSENYNFSAAEESLEKANVAKIDFSPYQIPISIEGETKASSDSWSLSQNSSAKLQFKPKKLNFSAEAKVNQKIPTSADGKEKFDTQNYFSSYGKITKFSFDSGDENAQKRSAGAKSSISYSFDVLKLKPAIFFETEGTYKSSSKITFTDTTKTGFDLPFSVKKNNFSLGWKKTAGSTDTTQTQKGGSFSRDADDLSKRLSEKSYFFKTFPIYDIISENLSKEVFDGGRDSNYYTGNYAFSWKRAFYANKYDFFIPQSAKLEFSRDIRTGTSTSDFYQIKSTVGKTAVNIFGRSGNVPIFSFFESDEYNSSFSAALKIPRSSPSDFSYLVSGYFQATFYFSKTDSLKQGIEGSFEGEDDWKAKYTIVWKRNAKSSLARGIVSIFSEKLYKSVEKITKTDKINAAASSQSSSSSSSPSTKKYSIAYSHATETSVTKYVSLNTEVGAAYSATVNKIATLSATATIGATIKF